MPEADGELVQFAERLLAGAIGAASARAMVASVIKGEGVTFDEIMQILDETSQVLEYSRQLEQKSKALEDATAELQAANEQLKELDQLKDEFLSTVTHELRTPLTSVRSFSEILYDTPDLKTDERQKFLGIIIRESERLTRLINQVLDLTKIEAGRMEWQMGVVDLKTVVEDAVATIDHRFKERAIELHMALPDHVPAVMGDRDQLMQVVINLLSNAEKFCRPKAGKVLVSLNVDADDIVVSVSDNGPGQGPGPDLREVPPGFGRRHRQSDGLGAGAGDFAQDRRVFRRPHLGREQRRPGRHVLVHHSDPQRPAARRPGLIGDPRKAKGGGRRLKRRPSTPPARTARPSVRSAIGCAWREWP
jgi:signal transduction histidine kinase